ncbi:hypothetical protein F2Q69_00046709 [Brassica cretica]|uniref:Uncharacterized protein n=1 Tax=Brassica cretica TaxID=69181 RepID=A0A8S9PU71_BRACR|nr:hypothetical protein F2Q69_00046709 [Brassica cretica]
MLRWLTIEGVQRGFNERDGLVAGVTSGAIEKKMRRQLEKWKRRRTKRKGSDSSFSVSAF